MCFLGDGGSVSACGTHPYVIMCFSASSFGWICRFVTRLTFRSLKPPEDSKRAYKPAAKQSNNQANTRGRTDGRRVGPGPVRRWPRCHPRPVCYQEKQRFSEGLSNPRCPKGKPRLSRVLRGRDCSCCSSPVIEPNLSNIMHHPPLLIVSYTLPPNNKASNPN